MTVGKMIFFVLLLITANIAYSGDDTSQCIPDVNCESRLWGLDAEIINSYKKTEPNLRIDHSIVFDRKYRRAHNAIQLYDSPNGQIISEIPQGFNFFTVIEETNGWTKISPDQWIKSSELTMDVNTSTFSGVYLSENNLEYTVAWVLVNLYPSTFPGGTPSEQNEKLWRYTLVNIFDTVQVEDWNWYQIGVDQWIKQTQVAKVLPIERPETVSSEYWISIDLYEQVLIAYENDVPKFATLVSSGMQGWETNEGTFDVYLKYNRTLMTGGEVDDFYYLQEVPWTMYFDGDIALHGAYWHDGFGYRRSHGCVNLSVMDAYLLYQWVGTGINVTENPVEVYVYSSGQYR